MTNRLRDKTISLSWLLSVSFIASMFLASPSVAEAGPLLDWLFQRNRAQTVDGYRYGSNAYYGNTFGNNSSYPGANSGLASSSGGFQNGSEGYAARNDNGYGGNYSNSNYPNYRAEYPGSNFANGGLGGRSNGVVRGQNSTLFPKCCLFGRGRSLFASNGNSPAGALGNSQLAQRQSQPNLYGRTAAYGGSCESGCQSGWCEQTVLRYTPQIAYRTTYQPVPVTTYKTTTTINPANGLPRTCTRPCTSYSYQARRVPYTTYRPYYTTVPVADGCGCGPNPSAQQQANFAPPRQLSQADFAPRLEQNLVRQPVSGVWGGCSSCQNNAMGGSQQGFGGGPGYTPGNATVLPPAPQSGPWSNQPFSSGGFDNSGNGVVGNGFGASPWQRVPGSGTDSGLVDTPGATPWRPVPRSGAVPGADQGFGSNSDSQTNIPWQRVPGNGATPPPSTRGNEADQPPTILQYRGGYLEGNQDSQSGTTRLRPVPISDEELRSLQQEYERNRIIADPQETTESIAPRSDPESYADQYNDVFNGQPIDQRLFETPSQSTTRIESPLEVNETRRPRSYQSKGVRDLMRERPGRSREDKTARDVSRPVSESFSAGGSRSSSTRSGFTRGERPVHEAEVRDPKSSRYASVPIDWSAAQADKSSAGFSKPVRNVYKWHSR